MIILSIKTKYYNPCLYIVICLYLALSTKLSLLDIKQWLIEFAIVIAPKLDKKVFKIYVVLLIKKILILMHPA